MDMNQEVLIDYRNKLKEIKDELGIQIRLLEYGENKDTRKSAQKKVDNIKVKIVQLIKQETELYLLFTGQNEVGINSTYAFNESMIYNQIEDSVEKLITTINEKLTQE